MSVRKLLCGTLASLLLVSSFGILTACKKNNKPRESNYIIQESDPWYTATSLIPADYLETNPYIDSLDQTIYSVGNDILVTRTNYCADENGYMRDVIKFGLFSSEGDYLYDNSLTVETDYGAPDMIWACREGDLIDIYYSDEDYDASCSIIYKIVWDINTNSLSEPVEFSHDLSEDSYILNSLCTENHFIVVENSYEEVGQMVFVYDKDDLIGKFDLTDENNGYISFESAVEENGILTINALDYSIESEGTGIKSFKYDLQTGSVIDIVEDGSSIPQDYTRGFDGRLYSAKADGIYAGDELYISYSDSDFNANSMWDTSILSVEPDKVILSGYKTDSYHIFAEKVVVFLERQNRNPNAGKMVINALSPTPLSNELTEGIIRFNAGDNKYFVKTDIRNIYEVDLDSDTKVCEYLKGFSDAIKSDNGPDLVFNAGELSCFLSDDMFLDLSKEIEMDEENYYTKIYDLSADDDKHFIIPLEFDVSGLIVESEYMDQGKNGFTFEEYEKYVNDVCDKMDPMGLHTSRQYYFDTCFMAMGDYWYKDGKADFESDDLKELLHYIKEGVPSQVFEERIAIYNTDYYVVGVSPNRIAQKCKYIDFMGSSEYAILASKYDDPVLCGVPSKEGTGPMAFITSSASITSNTGVKEGCIDFIRSLLSTEIQLNCEGFCMNKKAQSMLMSDLYQEELAEFSGNISKFQAEAQDKGYYNPDEKKLDLVEAAIERVYSVSYTNEIVMNVVNDQTCPYFDGLLDISTIDVIDQRIQNYLDVN